MTKSGICITSRCGIPIAETDTVVTAGVKERVLDAGNAAHLSSTA